jgi:hypothetical protein
VNLARVAVKDWLSCAYLFFPQRFAQTADAIISNGTEQASSAMLPRGVVIDSHTCGLVGQRWEKRGEEEVLRFFLRFLSLGIGPTPFPTSPLKSATSRTSARI